MSGDTAWVEEEELLRRCQRGDEVALEALAERFQARVFRLAYRVLADAARAEEATVDALSAVWDRCGSWRGEARAATWIHQVAWRVILDHQRARRRGWRFWEREAAVDARGSEELDPPTVVAADEERAIRETRVARALEQLSADERALVHLHYFEELSLAEIGVILGVSRDALKMRLSRTREKLRPLLGEWDEP